MQVAQTRRCFVVPLTSALTRCKFTFQRRRVTLCACEMLLPNCGPLPQTSQTCAMVELQIFSRTIGAAPAAGALNGCPRPRLTESSVYQCGAQSATAQPSLSGNRLRTSYHAPSELK